MNSNTWLRSIGYLLEIAALGLFFLKRDEPAAMTAAYALFAIGFGFIVAAYVPWRQYWRRESESIGKD